MWLHLQLTTFFAHGIRRLPNFYTTCIGGGGKVIVLEKNTLHICHITVHELINKFTLLLIFSSYIYIYIYIYIYVSVFLCVCVHPYVHMHPCITKNVWETQINRETSQLHIITINFWKNGGHYVKRKHSSKTTAGLQRNKQFFLAGK